MLVCSLHIRDSLITLPEGARFMHAEYSMDCWTTWWLVDPKAENETRQFITVGTGWPFESGDHLATAMDGDFVWHLFEVLK